MAPRLAALKIGRSLATASQARRQPGAARMWKLMSFVVALPAVAALMLNAFLKSAHEPLEFVPYEHLRIRNKLVVSCLLEPVLFLECRDTLNPMSLFLGAMGIIRYSTTRT
ncbi:cytochrome c oxidase subunit 6A, mitochondrial-like isoform X1 [Stegostoma tigrinum]|uniref:cytochrome c oxidase subunit 6A, mitochondrial-like isoform X1 n=1 Tax=Stegostoma tigrinum TaxID=3053191 RepID=UPI00202B8709|nr:cytochrome c oxidase subunit 6A, mitochondrial-like isoform X1 [Stegostoma tigrinum]